MGRVAPVEAMPPEAHASTHRFVDDGCRARALVSTISSSVGGAVDQALRDRCIEAGFDRALAQFREEGFTIEVRCHQTSLPLHSVRR